MQLQTVPGHGHCMKLGNLLNRCTSEKIGSLGSPKGSQSPVTFGGLRTLLSRHQYLGALLPSIQKSWLWVGPCEQKEGSLASAVASEHRAIMGLDLTKFRPGMNQHTAGWPRSSRHCVSDPVELQAQASGLE